jgi:hypothetical protein
MLSAIGASFRNHDITRLSARNITVVMPEARWMLDPDTSFRRSTCCLRRCCTILHELCCLSVFVW